MPRPRFAALNTDFVLALAGGSHQGAIDTLGRLGYYFLVSPVVEESLFDIHTSGKHRSSRETAAKALKSLAAWGFLTPHLDGLGRHYTREAAVSMRTANICPGCYQNDYLAVAEASHLEAEVLVTARPVVNCSDAINFALYEAELQPIRLLQMLDFA